MEGYKVFDSTDYNIEEYYFSLDYPNIHNRKDDYRFKFCKKAVDCFTRERCDENNGYAIVKSGSKYTETDGLVLCRELIIVKTLTYSEFCSLVTGNVSIENKNCNYVDGKLHGSYKEWHNKNILYKETTYVDGKLHGEYKQWHENGKICKETTYVDGKLHGSYKTWRDNNIPSINTTYVDGKLHGLYEEYRGTGEKKYHGRYRRWYGDGQRYGSGNIRHDAIYTRQDMDI